MRPIFATLALLISAPLHAQTITATIPPLAGFIGDLTRGATTAESLLPANSDAHHFSLSPSQIKTVSEASVIFAVGNDMEPWLARMEPHLAPGTVIKLGELEAVASLALEARESSDDHGHEEIDEHDEHHEIDPHQWLDNAILDLWAQEVAARLTETSPENANLFAENLADMRAELAEIDTGLQSLAARFASADIKIVVSHDAFQYLERRLGVEQAGMLSDMHDNAAGARSLSAISRLEGNTCLIIDPNEPLAEGILPLATRIEIDPLGAAYLGQENFTRAYFDGIIDALTPCLQSE